MASEPARQLPPAPQRVPPRDFDAEQACLGSMLFSADAVAEALAIVMPDDFYWEDHQAICRAVTACAARREPADLITVSAELRRLGKLEQVGGGQYLTALMSSVPTTAHVPRYANIVAAKSWLRRFIVATSEAIGSAFANPDDPLTPYMELQRDLHRLMDRVAASRERLRPVAEVAGELDYIVALAGQGRRPLSSARMGIDGLDELIGPLSDHRLVIVGARRGAGKTHVAVNAVCETCKALQESGEEGRVLVFSAESPGMYFRRMLAHVSHINSNDIRMGFNRETDQFKWAKLEQAREIIKGWPWDIQEGSITEDLFEADVRRALRKGPVSLVVCDYLQAMRKRRGRQQSEEFEGLAFRLRDLSDDAGAPVLLTSQLSFNQGTGAVQTKGSTTPEDVATLVMWLTYDKRSKKMLLSCEKTREGDDWGSREVYVDKRLSRVGLVQRRDAGEDDQKPLMAGGSDPFQNEG